MTLATFPGPRLNFNDEPSTEVGMSEQVIQ